MPTEAKGASTGVARVQGCKKLAGPGLAPLHGGTQGQGGLQQGSSIDWFHLGVERAQLQ
jgi:hypothetical protein